jgi:hypothetical protein
LMIHASRRIGIALEAIFSSDESFDRRGRRDQSRWLFELTL